MGIRREHSVLVRLMWPHDPIDREHSSERILLLSEL